MPESAGISSEHASRADSPHRHARWQLGRRQGTAEGKSDARRIALLAGFFILTLMLRWHTLGDPPAWDAAMGVYPAALTWVAEGPGILSAAPYAEGGPNVHALSPVTLTTALLVWATGGIPVVLLHLLHIALAAYAGLLLFDLLVRRTGTVVATVASLAALTMPVVQAQVSAMYLEIPLLVASLLTIRSWNRGSPGAAGFWAAVAVWTKPTGIVVAGGVVLASLLARRHADLAARLRWALWMAPALAVFGLLTLYTTSTAGQLDTSTSFLRITMGYLLRTTDLVVLVAVFVSLGVLLLGRARSIGYSLADVDRVILSVLLAVGLSVLAVNSAGFAYLPRYLASSLPLLVAIIIIWLSGFSRHLALIGSTVLIAASLLNVSGAAFPDNDVEDFALAERSDAYRGLVELHLTAADRLSQLPQGTTIVYGHGTHYRSRYPALGYFQQPLSGGVHAALDLPDDLGSALASLPDDFYMYYEYDWLGGEIVNDLWHLAESTDGYRVEVDTIAIRQFEASIIRVTRLTTAPGEQANPSGDKT